MHLNEHERATIALTLLILAAFAVGVALTKIVDHLTTFIVGP